MYKRKENIIIKEKNKTYQLIKIYNEQKILEINNILNNNTEYYKIIKNRNNEIITLYNNQKYTLIEENNDYIINTNELIIDSRNVENLSINQSDWIKLWTIKNDYIDNDNPTERILIESKDYYLGLAEIALQYIKLNDIKTNYLCICNQNLKERYNPLNIVLDCKEREIGELIKYYFFFDDITKLDIDKLIRHKNIKKIIARLLYPNYYFDSYLSKDINVMKEIIKKHKKYENFIEGIIKKYD